MLGWAGGRCSFPHQALAAAPASCACPHARLHGAPACCACMLRLPALHARCIHANRGGGRPLAGVTRLTNTITIFRMTPSGRDEADSKPHCVPTGRPRPPSLHCTALAPAHPGTAQHTFSSCSQRFCQHWALQRVVWAAPLAARFRPPAPLRPSLSSLPSKQAGPTAGRAQPNLEGAGASLQQLSS